MKKIFAIPYNGDSSLIDKVNKENLNPYIYEMYGSDGMFSHGRIIKQPESFESDIRYILDADIEFNYLLNSIVYDDYYLNKKKILEHIRYLYDIGIRTVTISHPVLACYVKESNTNIKISSSVNQFINTVQKATSLKEIGYDRILIDEDEIRNIKLVEEICKSVDVKVELIVNNACIKGCIHRYTHQTSVNSSSLTFSQKNIAEESVMKLCRSNFAKDKRAFLQATWIRPEDIGIYLNKGIDLFKISGRTFPSDFIVQTLTIYSKQSQHDNVLDYIFPFEHKNQRYGYDYFSSSHLDKYFSHIFYDDTHKAGTCIKCDEILIETIQNI